MIALRVFRKEGLQGVTKRIKRRLLPRNIQMRYRIGSTIRSSYGVRLATNFGDATFRLYVNGNYGRFYWDHLSEITEDFVFVDVGANQGLYSICAALNPSCKSAISFEPVARTFELLARNLKLNRVVNKCSPYQLALSDKAGRAKVFMNSDHSGGASIVETHQETEGDPVTIEIECISVKELDEILPTSDLPIYVKVDVEGYETVVLEELMKSLHASRIKEIFFEVDERWVDPAQLIKTLRAKGFQSFEKMGDGQHYDIMASR